jgi:hypothetical protein
LERLGDGFKGGLGDGDADHCCFMISRFVAVDAG